MEVQLRRAVVVYVRRCRQIALAIETENLSKVYGVDADGRRVGLIDLSLQVQTGQVFGLAGPNGSGKTTTLKLLLGLVFPDSGTAKVLGEPIGTGQYKERVGLVPEGPYFYDHLNAVELLRFYGGLFGLYGQELNSRIEQLLQMVGMWSRRNRQVQNYSRGMLQRVAVAQALLNDPDVVFMDEPTAGLDPPAQMHIRDIILRIKDRGKTVFLCSHLLKDMEPLCDNIAILDHGEVVMSGSMDEMLAGDDGHYRLTAEQVDEDVAAELTPDAEYTDHSAGMFEARFSTQQTAARAATTLSESGALVTGLYPDRRSLEEVFIEAVEEEGADSTNAAP